MGIFKPGSAELLPGKELPSKETWEKISDISLDSLPKLDLQSLNSWISEIKHKI